jgi:hypothetical protein
VDRWLADLLVVVQDENKALRQILGNIDHNEAGQNLGLSGHVDKFGMAILCQKGLGAPATCRMQCLQRGNKRQQEKSASFSMASSDRYAADIAPSALTRREAKGLAKCSCHSRAVPGATSDDSRKLRYAMLSGSYGAPGCYHSTCSVSAWYAAANLSPRARVVG